MAGEVDHKGKERKAEEQVEFLPGGVQEEQDKPIDGNGFAKGEGDNRGAQQTGDWRRQIADRRSSRLIPCRQDAVAQERDDREIDQADPEQHEAERVEYIGRKRGITCKGGVASREEFDYPGIRQDAQDHSPADEDGQPVPPAQ